MCHSIWQKVSFSPIPISGFWYVTDANSYLVFADVFVLVFLCYVSPRPFLWNATPIDSCWYIADALNGLWCTRCSVHEYAQLVFCDLIPKGICHGWHARSELAGFQKLITKSFWAFFSCPGQLNKWHCRLVCPSEPTNNQWHYSDKYHYKFPFFNPSLIHNKFDNAT